MTDGREAAERLIRDTYDLDETCSKCGVPYELALVFGDADCAIAVDVCPNCGYKSRCLTVDPAEVVLEHPYKQMHRDAMNWTPPWFPGRDDVTADWRCACGKTWPNSFELRVHAWREHPDQLRMSMVEHDRYPWRNTAPIEPES